MDDKALNSTLRLYAQGSAFEDGRFDLRYLERMLTNYRQIIDGALPIALGQKSLTERLKHQLRYEVRVRNGSLELIHDIIQSSAATAAYFSAADGSYALHEAIAKLVRDGINIRRAFAKFRSLGLRPMIHIGKINIDNSVHADNNTGKISVQNPSSVLCAEATRPAFDRMINDIDGDRVKSVDISSGQEQLALRTEDQFITGRDKEELNTVMELVGRINTVAFDAGRSTIVTGGKSYPVIWGDELRGIIHDIADQEGIVFKVRPILDRRQFRDDPIGFRILSCRDPQGQIPL